MTFPEPVDLVLTVYDGSVPIGKLAHAPQAGFYGPGSWLAVSIHSPWHIHHESAREPAERWLRTQNDNCIPNLHKPTY